MNISVSKSFSRGILLVNLLSLIALKVYAEPIQSIVEFYSYTCSHCASVNSRLDNYVASHKVDFMAVNIDNGENALPTNIMYYVAVDAGIGMQFKSAYFAAVASGMPAYTPTTLDYVVNQVKTPTFSKLLKSPDEKARVKEKLNFALYLLRQNKIQATPTFLINQTSLLEGEDIIHSLN